MSGKKILRIGIAPREAIKKRTIAIAKGELKPSRTDPRIWFTSLQSLAKVLSADNMLLLEMIRVSEPRSITELADLSGRAKSNLSRTLHNMERYGIISLDESEGGRLRPRVEYDDVECTFPIGTADKVAA